MTLDLTTSIMAQSAPRAFGPIVTARCAARGCPDRSGPVFVVLGLGGYQRLCATCRDYRYRLLRLRLPELRGPR